MRSLLLQGSSNIVHFPWKTLLPSPPLPTTLDLLLFIFQLSIQASHQQESLSLKPPPHHHKFKIPLSYVVLGPHFFPHDTYLSLVSCTHCVVIGSLSFSYQTVVSVVIYHCFHMISRQYLAHIFSKIINI